MKTLILPPRITEDSQAVASAARRVDWNVERLSSWHIPSVLRDEDIALYAEPLFVLHAAAELNLAALETPYDWLTKLPENYLHRQVELMTVAEARQITRRCFIKPAAEKFFTAAVFLSGEALPGTAALSEVVPVLVSEVVTWTSEFRCFILDRRCITSSPYLLDGQLARSDASKWTAPAPQVEAASTFVNRLLEDPAVSTPPAVVIDVGLLATGDWAVIEANPAWGSGIYGCDPFDVLKAVARSCVRLDDITDADRPWIIDHGSEDFR